MRKWDDYMLLKVSGIHYKGNKFMVNGYCENGNGCRSIPLNKVYLDREVLNNVED